MGPGSYTCKHCANTYTAEVVADLENAECHNYVLDEATKIAATCIAGGYNKYICADCAKAIEETTEVDTVNGHNWVVDEETYKKVTCTVDGYEKKTCSLCEEEVVTTTATTGHSMSVTDSKAATELEAGYTTYSCANCDYTNTVEIPKLTVYVVTTASELQNAIKGNTPYVTVDGVRINVQDGDIIRLGNDIEGYTTSTDVRKNIIIDLNGKTFKNGGTSSSTIYMYKGSITSMNGRGTW